MCESVSIPVCLCVHECVRVCVLTVVLVIICPLTAQYSVLCSGVPGEVGDVGLQHVGRRLVPEGQKRVKD